MLKVFLSSFSVVMVGMSCAFLSQIALARLMPAEEFGIYSFIFSLSLLLGVFALFGFQNSVVRLIAGFRTEKSPQHKIFALIHFSTFFTFALAIFFALMAYGGLYLLGYTKVYPIQSMMVGVCMVPLMVFMRINASYMRGFDKTVLSVLYETTAREVGFFGLIALMFLSGFVFHSGVQALTLLCLVLGVVGIIAYLHVRLYIRKQGKPDKKQLPKLISSEHKEWALLSMPMMLIIFAQRFLRRSDIIILGLMVNPVLVGAYAIAAQFSEVSSIGQKGIFAMFSPKAATLYKENKLEQLRALYRKMQLYGAMTTGGMCLLIAILAPYLMGFFGPTYTEGYNALLILLAGMFINVCFGPVGVLMIMTKFEKTAMNLTLLAALGNLICNPIAIYYMGLAGAATTTTFFLVLRALLSYSFVRKENLV